MTPDQVAALKEGDTVRMVDPLHPLRGPRGKVNQTLTDWVRVDWVMPFKNTYDILRRTSPLWATIELEPKT